MPRLKILLGLLTVLLLQSSWAYWQQEVHYRIEAEFIPKKDKIIGRENLVYTNNSPDTLETIYFHLYLNSFQPGSPMDYDNRKDGDYEIADLPLKEWGKMTVKKLSVNGQEVADYKIDYSVMEIQLPQVLLPGKKLEFQFEFEDQIPPNGARMGKKGKHYDIGQWYPKIAVYDRYGWHNEQYLGRGEFYSDFGKFEVSFTAPQKYILGHTGKLLNEAELFPGLPRATEDTVVHDILRKYKPAEDTSQRDVVASKESKGGNDKKDEPADSVTKEETRIWKMSAENVHDFFIAANPEFIWDRAQWKDVTINALYTKDVKDPWQSAAEETKFCLKFLSEKFGPYPYPQFTSVAGAVSGGMEYPQIITMNKKISNKPARRYFAVLAHEIAHNWFYGLIGSNETRQACLDEGFTTFATDLMGEARYGRYDNFYEWTNPIQKLFYANDDGRARSARNYLQRANQKREEPIDTHSDRFADPGNYRVAVYSKTSSIMFMLQYVLGDSLFDSAMKEYFKRWHWKHPYLIDFQHTMEEVYGKNLDWFFDQWFEKTRVVDFGIKSVKSQTTKEGNYLTQVKIKKNKEGVMPLDLAFRLPDGTTKSEKIPVEVWFRGADEYVASATLPEKPISVEINPDQRVMDVNRLNNTYYKGLPAPFPRLKVKYNFLDKYKPVPLDAYQFLFNPSFWYNDADGLKSGLRLKGSYLEWSHNLDLGMWMGPMSGRFNYDVSWKEPTFWLGNATHFKLRSFYLEGRRGGSIVVEKDGIIAPAYREYFKAHGHRYGAGFYAYRLKDERWIPPTVKWQRGDFNFLKAFYRGVFPGRHYDQQVQAYLTTDFLRSDYNFNKLFLEYRGQLDKFLPTPLSWRVTLGYGSGKGSSQSRFYLVSASPLEEFENPWYRSAGTLPNEWREEGNLYMPGGANLRGYTERNLSGKRIFGLNFKGTLPNPFKPIKKQIPVVSQQLNSLQFDLFHDFGSVWDTKNPPGWQDFFSDAGIGIVYKIPYLDQIFSDSRIRFDFPIWLDKPEPGEKHFKFRWLFSIGAGI